jgi:imidazole glycerol-phosphate synthase subunit HisF
MSIKRIIPILLIENDKLVKTTNFSTSKYIGDPINAVKIFSEKEADEIIIIDIEASKKNFINFDLISKIFGESFVPITYGGGIRSLEDAKKIINLGAEKISIQSIFFEDIQIVKEIIKNFGSQSVVLSIDIKKNIFGNYKIWNYKKNNFYEKYDLSKIVDHAITTGIGEIIFTDVDNEGTMKGTNKDLLNIVSKNSSIPIIFNGGIKDINDIKLSLESKIDAIGVGSFFVFYGKLNAVLISYPTKDIKEIINDKK